MRSLLLLLLCLLLSLARCLHSPVSLRASSAAPRCAAPVASSSRRQLATLGLLASGALLVPRVLAAPKVVQCDGGNACVWLSGRSDPIRQTSKDKPDGTKKDPKYLRCLNDCVPRCQGPPSQGEQKDRLDCFEECQDECCFTYQQCTYKIRQ